MLKHPSMRFPFGQTRLRFRKACKLLSRTGILTHVSSSMLRRLRLIALANRYPDVFRLQASNYQELHHLSIHKCVVASWLVKVRTFLTTLNPPLVPPNDSDESLREAYPGITVVNKMAHFTLTDETNKKCGSYHKWIFSCISSRFSVFLLCLASLYYFSFFLSFYFPQICTYDNTYHAGNDSTTVRSFVWCHWAPMHLCTVLTSLLQICNSTISFHFFSLAALHLFFLILHFRWQLSCRQGQYHSQLMFVLSLCHWVPASMHSPDEFLSEL